jgi:hypothetical protein
VDELVPAGCALEMFPTGKPVRRVAEMAAGSGS